MATVYVRSQITCGNVEAFNDLKAMFDEVKTGPEFEMAKKQGKLGLKMSSEGNNAVVEFSIQVDEWTLRRRGFVEPPPEEIAAAFTEVDITA